MEPGAKVFVEQSYKVSDIGIVSTLRHYKSGLRKGVQLISQMSAKVWLVRRRLVYHALKEQRGLNGDGKHFKKLSQRLTSKQNKNTTFDYILEPLGHNEKPKKGEALRVF